MSRVDTRWCHTTVLVIVLLAVCSGIACLALLIHSCLAAVPSSQCSCFHKSGILCLCRSFPLGQTWSNLVNAAAAGVPGGEPAGQAALNLITLLTPPSCSSAAAALCPNCCSLGQTWLNLVNAAAAGVPGRELAGQAALHPTARGTGALPCRSSRGGAAAGTRPHQPNAAPGGPVQGLH